MGQTEIMYYLVGTVRKQHQFCVIPVKNANLNLI